MVILAYYMIDLGGHVIALLQYMIDLGYHMTDLGCYMIDLGYHLIRNHTYIILTPLKSHFYAVKLGFTGVYIILLISAQKHRLWVLVRTTSARWF